MDLPWRYTHVPATSRDNLPTSPTDPERQPSDQPPELAIALERCAGELKSAEREVAELRAALETARSLALHDPLTKLANRELFDEKLANALAIAVRRTWSLAVLFLDLDSFKSVNNAHGHAAGDLVLREVADRLVQCSREEDTVCRYGGDEFLYLLIDPKSRDNIEAILSRTQERIRDPLEVGHEQLTISVSVGVAVYPDDGLSGEQLIARADSAMYQAKNRKSGFHFFADSTSGSERG
jgi:diguanylate cyclase